MAKRITAAEHSTAREKNIKFVSKLWQIVASDWRRF
jgi:hypothetical protein